MIGRISALFLLLYSVLASDTFSSGRVVGVTFGHYNIGTWGDSLTAGVGTATPYPSQLGTITGFTVFNGGTGGDTSTQITTRFLADTTHRQWCTVIWSGNNNFASQSTILTDIASIVSALPAPKCYVVLSLDNGNQPLRHLGQSEYNQIISDNSALLAAYPNNYYDIRSYLVSQATASAEDVIDKANDVPPTSLRNQNGAGTLNGAIASTSTCTINLTNTGAVTVIAGFTITVGSEKIYVSSDDGAGNITGCTRGYAGTTAATHLTGVAFTGIDAIHLNTAGNLIVAQQLQSWMLAHFRP